MLEEGRVVATAQIGELGMLLAVRAPEIAAQAHAGQFVHVRPGVGWDPLLRRPYSFCGIERRTGEVELIVKPLGTGGEWIAERHVGDALDLLGPLGTSFVVRRDTRNLLLVAGGTGIAPMRVIAEQEALRRNVTLVMGGRACVIVTSEGNARVCREGPVFALGDIVFEAGEPATVGVH